MTYSRFSCACKKWAFVNGNKIVNGIKENTKKGDVSTGMWKRLILCGTDIVAQVRRLQDWSTARFSPLFWQRLQKSSLSFLGLDLNQGSDLYHISWNQFQVLAVVLGSGP